MNNRFVIIMAVAVALFVGLIIFNKKDSPAPAGGNSAAPSEHVRGEGAEVTLVEYGDFQCQACAAYYPIIKAVKEEYGDRVAFQFRHFPIVSIHPNAMSAHRAAEAAAKQDKFWEMHDILYERQQSWSTSNSAASVFEGYANELGLDMDKYRHDLASSETQAVINADIKASQEFNVGSTPTFILNGKKIEENPRDLEGFSKLIDKALASE